MLLRIYRSMKTWDASLEECFYVEVSRELKRREKSILTWLLSDPLHTLHRAPQIANRDCVEIGPRLSVETPFSSRAVAICNAVHLPILRMERSTRLACTDKIREAVIAQHLDPMTQEVYAAALSDFGAPRLPDPVEVIDVLCEGVEAMRKANKKYGLGMDAWDEEYTTKVYLELRRNPTNVELVQIGNGNSEHSRHWFFRGRQVIDGIEMPETLMDLVKEPWKRNPRNSLIAFHDNSGAIKGTMVKLLGPLHPGQSSMMAVWNVLQHITSTAETHNHPTLIAPFPGAETGAGGRIRDSRAVGRGGLVHAGLAGYCVGNLHIPGYKIPGEDVGGEMSRRHASPLRILIEGSNGVSDYGNKIGEPLIGGFCRSFGQIVDGKRREFRKPVLYSAGLGRLLDCHLKKQSPAVGMLIVQIGPPAYRIGVSGGSASSMIHGSQSAELDTKSVQRGDAQAENSVNRVLQTCAEMLEANPIESLHDQGAGGPSNVLTELMDPVGGKINIRAITVGDKTMSVLELWVAEYQERYGLLVRKENIGVLQAICKREGVSCEVLGEITGDGRVVVEDPQDGTMPVDLPLKKVLGDLPQKKFASTRKKLKLPPLEIPDGLSVRRALEMIFKLPGVGSKGFLVHKVDRSVTGLVARQQCCGPLQVPVADVAVTADGYFGLTGAATALGEQPNKMLISPEAGARKAVVEAITNMCAVRISDLKDLKFRANWMWAAKLPGEGANIYDAAVSLRDIMLRLGIAIDGGKDSLSMATEVESELVVSPGELVIKGYAPVPDITKVLTPDLKGGGCLGWIKFSGHSRLGGSALAQALGQLGNVSPDINARGVQKLIKTFRAVQELIDLSLLTAYHDVSDGGLITAIAEMCIAGLRGAQIRLEPRDEPISTLFSEEAGMVLEYAPESENMIAKTFVKHGVPWSRANRIGQVASRPGGSLQIWKQDEQLLNMSVRELRVAWEATSNALEAQQTNPEAVESQRLYQNLMRPIPFRVTFTPQVLAHDRGSPNVAVLRERGTNGDREMIAALFTAGLNPMDVAMSDLVEGRLKSLDEFQGLIFPGGFSYADVLGSAKGWAGTIRFSPNLRKVFDRFYARKDTFSLGVCNGFQLMTQIGWVPGPDIAETRRPWLAHNSSGRFEHRFVGVRILESPSILFKGMEGSVLGVNIAHGEGRIVFPDKSVGTYVRKNHLACMEFVDPDGKTTEAYPYNPNGSPRGWTALCSPDGRHTGMMPHPERTFLKWQWPWMPENLRSLEHSPWLQMFVNARTWCLEQ